jgi:hypothetical protein
MLAGISLLDRVPACFLKSIQYPKVEGPFSEASFRCREMFEVWFRLPSGCRSQKTFPKEARPYPRARVPRSRTSARQKSRDQSLR